MRLLAFVLILVLAAPLSAQDPEDLPFMLDLVEVEVTDMPGLHSFAWAEHGGKWLFVGGRNDGLHGVIESGAFPSEQSNDALWVVDLAADQVWSRSLDELGASIADPLKATNPQFHQDGDTLYIVGGYGTDSATDEKTTFPTLTAIAVPAVIEAVTMGGDLAPHVRQLEDERLAVTGGELRSLQGDEFLLIGGHRFDGEYTFDGSGFVQEYTEQIFAFSIENTEASLAISELYTYTDADVLHRRDMTVAPTYVRLADILGNCCYIAEAFALYGGVFQPTANIPFRTQVYFWQSDTPEYGERSAYEQQFAHYTAPALSLWDAEAETMHTSFFGGMAQFIYDEETDAIKEDLLIPFTDDIVTFTEELSEDPTQSSTVYETVMPIQMPGLLGANAVFIPAPDALRSAHGVVDLRAVEGRTLMGWIVGGIESTMPHPGWNGITAAETSASDRILAVYLTPDFGTASEPSATPVEIAFEAPHPNPFRAEATVAFTLDRPADLAVEVFDVLGQRVATLHDGPLGAQHHTFPFRPGDLPSGVYTVRIHGDGVHATRSIVRIR